MADLASCREDIRSLEAEAFNLQQRIETLRTEYAILDASKSLNSVILAEGRSTEPASRPARKRKSIVAQSVEETVAQPNNHHIPHKLLQRLFEKLEKEQFTYSETVQLTHNVAGQLNQLNELVEKAETENFYRFTGVTSFPVEDFGDDSSGDEPGSSVAESSGSDDRFLGIRIDTFSRGEFLSPHYIVLKRDAKTGDWQLFKHTIPVFIPLQELADLYLPGDVELFAYRARSLLVLHNEKANAFDHIDPLTFQQPLQISDNPNADTDLTASVSVTRAEYPNALALVKRLSTDLAAHTVNITFHSGLHASLHVPEMEITTVEFSEHRGTAEESRASSQMKEQLEIVLRGPVVGLPARLEAYARSVKFG